jgi:DNA repair exonuclease SbcCD ATPase subunit
VILTRLQLTNWMRYRGQQELELGAKVYGIVARDEADPERSNWKGKTSLVEAIRFALYGEHRFQREDDWITKGADHGGVVAQFDSAIEFASRTRRRGGRTLFEAMGGKGDHAQAAVVKALCMTRADFEATVWVGQRETARLVLAEPAERQKTVDGWLDLGKLRAAEKHNADKLAKLEGLLEGVTENIRLNIARRDYVLAGRAVGDLAEELALAEENSTQIDRQLQELRAELRKVAEVDRLRDRLARFRRDEAEAKALEEQAAKHDVGALRRALEDVAERIKPVSSAVAISRAHLREVEKLEKGKFDGKCPLVGIECPARDQINKATSLNREVASRAREGVADAERIFTQLQREEREAIEALNEGVRAQERARDEGARLGALRQELEGARVQPVDEEGLRAEQKELEARRDVLMARRALLKVQIRQVAEVEEDVERCKRALADLERQIAPLRAAAEILGPRGARRRIAQPFFEELEAGANDALAECGSDLRVKVAWEREGKDPAKACDQCGAAFPESARVKECARCGAPRGRHVVEILEFEFSDRSVAAEDLAGVTTQLAAAAWLRQARGSPVSFAVLDEPMAHCDRANRRAMTRAFTHMLAQRFSFEQAFVITHTPDAAAFPGTILVTGRGPYSTVEVVS